MDEEEPFKVPEAECAYSTKPYGDVLGADRELGRVEGDAVEKSQLWE